MNVSSRSEVSDLGSIPSTSTEFNTNKRTTQMRIPVKLNGSMLSSVYKRVTNAGFKINVISIDGQLVRQQPRQIDHDESRLNVHVRNGLIARFFLG